MDKIKIKHKEIKQLEKFEKLLEIKHFLEKGTFQLKTLKSNKNSLRQFAKRFLLQDDRLFHLSQRHGKRMAILNESDTYSIISDCHEDPDGSHYGLVTTFATISRNYYWPTMWLDTRAWVNNCPICQQTPDSLTDSNFPKNRWETLLLDYLGPFPQTSNGNTHLLLCMDVFTRFAVIHAISDTSPEHLAHAFVEGVLYIYGQCNNLVILQKEEHSQKIYDEIIFNITMGETMLPVFYRQASRVDIAKFQTLKTSIEFSMKDAPKNWELYAKDFVFTYNTIKDTNTLESPFYLMFLRHPSPSGVEKTADVKYIEEIIADRLNESRKKTIKWFPEQKRSNNFTQIIEQPDYTQL